ncbi:MAG: GntR family transcriptional regulator [Spirochaetaceae bacterium]|jgi:GntR family transcriptional regulator|nr:GntR family transcriptional regulator [Spirochaetaceae bacterium]
MNSTIPEPESSGGEGISFSLDTDTDVPIYRQIIRQIEYAILSGRALPGDKLPTIRSLAVSLRINPNTIARAYGELEIRGVLATQVGRGTYVSDQAPLLGEAMSAEEGLARKIREVLGRFVQDMEDLGMEGGELISAVKNYIDGKERLPLSENSRI